VRSRRFFPLDAKLRLRRDHWSTGAARVAAREGLQAPSFDLAAAAFTDAVGARTSGESVRRVTQGWGKQREAGRGREAARALALAQQEERPTDRRLPPQDPIVDQANVSTDGVMVLLRQEGWKEVKLTTISAVQPIAARPSPGPQPTQEREARAHVKLTRHSYQAGLWDADTIAEQQYAEGVRRGLGACAQLSSVNDGAVWIERITRENFPDAVQIVDWSHASERLWAVGHAVFGAQTAQATQWTEVCLSKLWHGQVGEVVNELVGLALEQGRYPQEVQQAAGYFTSHAERMAYDAYREAGLPRGSGTVESGARSVVQQRMKRPGRGWERESGQAMLAGLSELHSGRFEQAWHTPCSIAA
jgi:hypothetical protein